MPRPQQNGRSFLVCQNRRARWARPCGATLYIGPPPPAEFTGRVLRDSREGAADCIVLWCQKCKRASEYRPTSNRVESPDSTSKPSKRVESDTPTSKKAGK